MNYVQVLQVPGQRLSSQQSSSAMESWPHWAGMDHAGGRASSWLDHGPDVFLALPRLAGGHQAAAITQPLFFYLKVNLMAAFIKLFTALNVEVISTYFFLIQHSEHIGVLLQLFPCPKVKKKCSICYLDVSVIRHTKDLRKHKHRPSVLYCNSGKENHTKPRKG